MKVPLLNPGLGNASFMSELVSTASRVLTSGQYILGAEVDNFESSFAEYLEVNHAIGVSSGTDALIASLIAMDVGPGDEVICPSFTFFATAGAIARVGATPVFVDILPDCFTLDPAKILDAITGKTKAIIPVHLFGQSASLSKILKIAKDHNLYVIEDAAQAIGCQFKGKQVGTFGDTGCFSFFPSKNLGGFGDAGLVVTNSSEVAEKIRSIRNHGMKTMYRHDIVGGNFRIDALQAALLTVKLKYFPEIEVRRIEHANFYYDRTISDGIVFPPCIRGKHIYNQFTLRIPEVRNEVQQALHEADIISAVYYPVPLHQQECFSRTTPKDLCLPETERASLECLSIPVAAELITEQLVHVANSL